LKRPDSAMVRIPASVSNTGADAAEAILTAAARIHTGRSTREQKEGGERGDAGEEEAEVGSTTTTARLKRFVWTNHHPGSCCGCGWAELRPYYGGYARPPAAKPCANFDRRTATGGRNRYILYVDYIKLFLPKKMYYSTRIRSAQ
jgi:hypothetical protein